jgi:hypothetical protein
MAIGQERVRNMVAAVRYLTNGKGTGFFLFTDQETLGTGDPLSVEWTSGEGGAS